MIDLSKKLGKNQRYAADAGANYNDEHAQIIGGEIERIRLTGDAVTPRALLCAARPPASPIHDMFDWNDTVAANKWREKQAQYIINHLRIVTISDGGVKTERAEYSLTAKHTTRKGNRVERQYYSVSEVRESPILRAELVAKAIAEIRSWTEKYQAAGLTELSPIFEAASNFVK